MSALTTLRRYNACEGAIEWVGKRTPAKAWAECPRGDWMLWIAARAGVERKLLVRAACDCVRTALKYVPKDELRPLRAIETAERWCEGKATLAEVRAAAYAYAAASAASAASVAVADAAASAAARTKARKRHAALVRKRIPWPIMRAALKAGAK